ncbi:hypothetical protein C8F04DRAFT_1279917 [Mycena alexandri]|uniref:Uncharacterized protein n=1 Tax=Mycena alexandri TaxID=1745969 RepID=A0AAD6RXM1_9AGAR|nr:hypothetical protein C8F04DRAFT_1279917 [Mycena alexandri]
MTRPTSGHPSLLWPDPPPHYVSCTIPLHWGNQFNIQAHSKQNNRFFWLLYMTKDQGAYLTKATVTNCLPTHADFNQNIKFFDTYEEMLRAWRKFCFQRHRRCPAHFACHTPCALHLGATTNPLENATAAAASAMKAAHAAGDALAHAEETQRAANRTLHSLRVQGALQYDELPTPRIGPSAPRGRFAARMVQGRGRGGGVGGSPPSARAAAAESSAAAAASTTASSPGRRYTAATCGPIPPTPCSCPLLFVTPSLHIALHCLRVPLCRK